MRELKVKPGFTQQYFRMLKCTGCSGQAELARRLKISQATISDSRRRGEIRPDILLALLEQFNLDPQWIRTGDGERCRHIRRRGSGV